MRRVLAVGRLRGCAASVSTLSGLGQAAMEQYESELRAAEDKVNKRKVVFASAASGDHRPRVAAAEAFDVAAAALPRPPNFVFTIVSFDNSTMSEAPEAVWRCLTRAAQQQPTMLGTAVKFQRPGNGYVQVLAGCIPDLTMECFTLDYLPRPEELSDPSKPPPFAAVSFVDPTLAIEHEGLINGHLNTLLHGLRGAPIIGSVCAPLSKLDGTSNGSQFFFNDSIFNGSAAAAILRSNFVKCSTVPVVPSIAIGSGTVTELRSSGGCAVEVVAIDGKPVLDVVKALYEGALADRPQSKVYFGVAHGSNLVPVTFRGDRDKKLAAVTLPNGVQLREGDTVQYVVDDVEMDTEASASLLLHMRDNQLQDTVSSVEKSIHIQREGRKYVVCSSCAGLHFSHPQMNQIAHRNDLIDFSEGATLHAPSVLQRCVGTEVPNTGAFAPGQVVTLGGASADDKRVAYVGSRSSVYAFFAGKE